MYRVRQNRFKVRWTWPGGKAGVPMRTALEDVDPFDRFHIFCIVRTYISGSNSDLDVMARSWCRVLVVTTIDYTMIKRLVHVLQVFIS